MNPVSIVLIFIIFAVFYAISIYNRLVRLKNQTEEGWSGISVQLKRRYDLIPNLVNCVKGYAAHEQATFDKVIEKRNQAMNLQTPAEKAAAEKEFAQTLKSLFALSENYPDLKANTTFIELQQSMNTVEDDLQNARRYYNATVRDLNTAIDAFPSNIIAAKYGFGKRDFFEVDESEKQNVKVSF
ncbi:MAG: LemA family protein [Alphaproteobacteria bacterium]|nr:LemA family protein [Alphaproteobacteria bacterium]MBO4644197.1 LemA family protein [Alphaproteobacteria bacterium]